MAIIKEFREFFLRHIQVNSGPKKDQETSFPTNYMVGSNNVFNRFLKSDFPSENVFKKLFESIAFKLNIEDTAKLTEQGLVRRATDMESFNRSGVTSGFQNVVTPEQLTEVKADIVNNVNGYLKTGQTTNPDITVEVYEKTFTVGSTSRKRKEFNIKKTVPIIPIELVGIGIGYMNVSRRVESVPFNPEFPINEEINQIPYELIQNRKGLDIGIIVLFNSDVTPVDTYKLCDGTGGTPDLRLISPSGTKYYQKVA